MSKVLKEFKELFFRDINKLFQNHTPGNRIIPAKNQLNDAKWQVRTDAGEVIDGRKYVYLQANKQAKNDALKEFIRKEGTDANLATSSFDVNTKEEDRSKVVEDVWEDLSKQAKEKLG